MPWRFTVTLRETDPPLPLQVRVKIVVAVNATDVSVPAVDFAPPQPLLAEHLAAFVLLQVRVAVDPDATTLGSAENVTVGTGEGDETGGEPPPPPPPPHPARATTVRTIVERQVFIYPSESTLRSSLHTNLASTPDGKSGIG